MRNLKLNLFAIVVALAAISQPGFAEEEGFYLENSIRQQIFFELKSNVHGLYKGLDLLVPEIDQAEVARVADSQGGESVILPASSPINAAHDKAALEKIN